ncbi:MAG TPA: glycosyltransferase, partial [Candidatus Paceibacterota bacterium]
MMANHAGFAALFFKYLHPRVPYFLELQDGRALVEMRERRRILIPIWWLYRRIFLKADRIKAISKYIASEVRALGYEREIEIIPNGVDVAKFSAPIANEKLQALKTKYGKKMGDVFLFTASRLVLSRGVEDIIRALPLLPQSVKLLIAGDGEDRSKLEKTSEECGVRNRTLFAGSINNSEIPAYFKISDIFVRPSIIEGFGSAFVEAFAAGIPIIATPVGGIPDFLFPPEKSAEPTGLFCRVRDPKSISEAIKQYMNDPSMTSRIIKNARKLATEKYDWNLIAADMHRKIFGKV